MRIQREIANIIPPAFSFIPIGMKHYFADRKRIDIMLETVSQKKKLAKRNGSYSGNEGFYRSLREYCVFFNLAGADKYLDSYFGNKKIALLKRVSEMEIPKDEVIMICCVRNDLNRVKKVYSHHKDIGINYMVFVDNMSDDGTREWLMQQEADVYSIDEDYHAGRKAAWVREVQDIYGYDRWYLIVDSDELFSYVGMEEHTIKDVTEYAKKNSIKRVRSILLDMYSDHEAYQSRLYESEFDKEYCYFDRDTYYMARDCRGEMVRGGPRKRVFKYENGYDNPLTKYPLIFAGREDVWGDHTPVPFKKNFGSNLVTVLRHYKFICGDYEKYTEAARNGRYYGDSIEYRTYVSWKDNPVFFYEGSCKYDVSRSLMQFGLMQKMWD